MASEQDVEVQTGDENHQSAVLTRRRRRQAASRKELAVYAVVFDHAPMGVNLQDPVRFDMTGAVVKALKDEAKSHITVGDFVYGVNDTVVLSMPYKQLMALLRATPYPVTVHFVPSEKRADLHRLVRPHKHSQVQRPIAIDFVISSEWSNATGGRIGVRGRVTQQWKWRWVRLVASKIECLKHPASEKPRRQHSFQGRRCTVRHVTGSAVLNSPLLRTEFLVELRIVGDTTTLLMAFVSAAQKQEWMDAFKLVIDVSARADRAMPVEEAPAYLRSHLLRRFFNEWEQSLVRVAQMPVVRVQVLSAVNLPSAKAVCEITLYHETFETALVMDQHSLVWEGDGNTVTLEAPLKQLEMEVRVFDQRLVCGSKLLASLLTIPINSLPKGEKVTRSYPLEGGSEGAEVMVSLEYMINETNLQQEQERGDTVAMDERDELTKVPE